ncbi:MAG: phosphotransferase family protein [Phycisphaerae bacterium]
MLNVATRFPSDAVFGESTDWLDPDAVLEAVRSRAVDIEERQRLAWRSCRMIEALYHPGRYLRAAYVLTEDSDVPAARAWPEGQVIYLNYPVRRPVSRRGAVIDLGGVEAEVYCFPNDRRLRGLRKFAGRVDAVRQWQSWLDERGNDFRIDPDSLQRLLVRYVPEQKWVVRIRAQSVPDDAGASTKRRIAVRSAAPEACRKLAARHRALSHLASDGSMPFGVPRVVGLAESDAILATEWIRGQKLTETLSAGDDAASIARVASILAELHSLPIGGLDVLTPQHTLGQVQHAVSDLTVACPDEKARLGTLADKLERRLATVDPVAPVSLHNDFHWNQLTIKKDRWTLLDLERMASGDPMVDVANFAMQLRTLGDRPEIDVTANQALRWAGLFLEAWRRLGRTQIDADRFRSYAVVSLLQLARGMMRHLRPGWADLTRCCLDRAETLLNQTGGQVTLS